MRHRNHRHILGRPTGERVALLRNLAIGLIATENGSIRTTREKAKALRPFIEKLITLGKRGQVHHRRLALARLNNKSAVEKIFAEIAPRYANRNGGYTRIVHDGQRMGDGAWMAYIQFVEDVPAAAAEAAAN